MDDKIMGYCVKCKQTRELADGHEVRFPVSKTASRPAMKGVCGTCGASMFKILPSM